MVTENYDLIPSRRKIFFSSPNWPEELWGAASLILNAYQEFSTQRQSSLVMQLIPKLHVV
jgi:hypothetical protein